MKIPEYIKECGTLERPFIGYLTTIVTGVVSGSIALIVLGENPEKHFRENLDEIATTNVAIFLSGFITSISAWIYHGIPKKVDAIITELVDDDIL